MRARAYPVANVGLEVVLSTAKKGAVIELCLTPLICKHVSTMQSSRRIRFLRWMRYVLRVVGSTPTRLALLVEFCAAANPTTKEVNSSVSECMLILGDVVDRIMWTPVGKRCSAAWEVMDAEVWRGWIVKGVGRLVLVHGGEDPRNYLVFGEITVNFLLKFSCIRPRSNHFEHSL